MTPQEEKRIYRLRKIIYLLMVIMIEIVVYTLLYVVFSLINYLHEFNPYLRFIILIVFFPLSYYITSYLAHSKLVDEVVNGL